MMKIPFSPPDIGEDEIKLVTEVLKTGWITTGPKTKLLEKKIGEYCHTGQAVCLNSQTACAEMTLRILRVGPGDEVIVPAYTYTATASIIYHVGATPVMIDCKPDSYEMDYDKMEEAINERTKEITALVDRLLVRIDFLDGIYGGTGVSQQIVIYLQTEGADDGKVVFDHQIVHLIHRTGGGVFNRQDAVLAQALLDSRENTVKIFEIQDKGILEDLLAGNLGVCALHTLTGYHAALGEQVVCVFNGLCDSLVQRGDGIVTFALITAAQLKQHGIQHTSVVGHLRSRFFRHILQLLPFPCGYEDRQVMLFFIFRDLCGYIHPLCEQLDQFIVDGIDLTAKLVDIHIYYLLPK